MPQLIKRNISVYPELLHTHYQKCNILREKTIERKTIVSEQPARNKYKKKNQLLFFASSFFEIDVTVFPKRL